MHRSIKKFVSFFIFIMMIACFGVFAEGDSDGEPVAADTKSVLSMNVSKNGNSIIVSGKTEEGMLAVAVAVYDKSGKKLVTMRTAGVDDSNSYESSTIELSDGKYVVKVADYNGGKYLTKSIQIGTEKKENEKENKSEESKEENAEENKTSKNEENKDTGKSKSSKAISVKTGDDQNVLIIMSVLGFISSFAAIASLRKNKN
ncbi:MAG: hypothetical protein Q4D57_03455 [Clostridia bacterium]|nr:hypothetical protein [Clostridia bacterium]